MQLVQNGLRHGLPRMVNAVGTEWVMPGLLRMMNAVGTEWVTPWVTEDGECSGYGMGHAMGYQG